MLIPNKFNGYSRDGIRLYHFGGGGRGRPAAPPPPPPRMASAAPAPEYTTYGSGDMTGSLVQSGNSFRPSALDYSRPIYDPNHADNITGYQQSSQFFQPIYQSQPTNYTTTNPLGVSQYGTPMTASSLVDSAYAGVGRFGVGTGTNQMDAGGRQHHIDAFQTGYYTPENFFQKFANSVQNYQTQNPNDRYTQYMQNQAGYGGGYQGYMPPMQTPFSYQPMQQPMQQAQPNYGPSQAIVGRSSQMRGTPNVMRRAEGGIASLLDNDE